MFTQAIHVKPPILNFGQKSPIKKNNETIISNFNKIKLQKARKNKNNILQLKKKIKAPKITFAQNSLILWKLANDNVPLN